MPRARFNTSSGAWEFEDDAGNVISLNSLDDTEIFVASLGSGQDYGNFGAAITAYEASDKSFALFLVVGSVESGGSGIGASTKPMKFVGLNRSAAILSSAGGQAMIPVTGGVLEFENLTLQGVTTGPLVNLNGGTDTIVRMIDVDILGGVNSDLFRDVGDGTRFEFVRSSISMSNAGFTLVLGNTGGLAADVQMTFDQCEALSANLGDLYAESTAGAIATMKLYLRNGTVIDRPKAIDDSVVLDVFLDGTSLWTDDGGVTATTKRVHGDNFYSTDMDGLTGLDIEAVLENSTAARILLGEGTFTTANLVSISNSMTVMGSGRDKTTLLQTTSSTAFQVSAVDFSMRDLKMESSETPTVNLLVFTAASDHVDIRRVDFEISGGASSSTLVNLGSSGLSAIIEDCTFSASSGEVDTGIVTSNGANVHISRCTFTEVAIRAIRISSGSFDCSIKDCHVTLLAPGSGSQIGLLIEGRRVVVRDCTVDGNATAGSSIDCISIGTSADFVTIDGCNLINQENGDGIHITTGAVEDITITNCKISGIGDLNFMLMGIRSSDSERLSVRGCVISNCFVGIQVEDNTQVSGCHIRMLSASAGVSTGINVLGNDVTITDCIIEGNGNDEATSAGIDVSSGTRVTIQNCTISNLQNISASCIELTASASEVAIGGCDLSPGGARAIEGSSADSVTVSNCNIANTGANGGIQNGSGSTKWTITGCHFSDYAGDAIQLVTTDCKITNCTFLQPASGGNPIDLDANGRVVVSGNNIDMTLATTGDAIFFQTGTPVNGVITNNTIEACPGNGIRIAGSSSSYFLIADNYIRIDTITGTGINLAGNNGQVQMVQDNIIETAGAGIFLGGNAAQPNRHMVAKGNHITGTGGSSTIGIESEANGADIGPVIQNNIIVDMNAQGILLNPISTETVSGFVISGNTVRNCTGNSIEVVDAFRGVINGNQCLAGGDDGINLVNVEDTVVVGNLVEGHLVASKAGIREDSGSASNNISANIVTNNTANLSLAGSPAAIVNGDNIST